MTTPYAGFNTSNPLPVISGYQANPQNYPWRSPYFVDAFASAESPHGPQVTQVPTTIRYYGQTMYPSVAHSPAGWVSTYGVCDTATAFSTSNGGHQNANLGQASHYAPPEAYAYGRDMLLESPSTTESSSGRNTFGELSFGTAGMQAAFMPSYSGTMPESSEYYRPAERGNGEVDFSGEF